LRTQARRLQKIQLIHIQPGQPMQMFDLHFIEA
jgi:hypothetical protein